VASSLSNWAPLPQGVLLALLVALVGVVHTLRKPALGGSSSEAPRELRMTMA
jgi:hypothetical protein